jgi:hypothetical protein
MYRAPASNSSGTGFLMLMLLVFGALYFSGCTDSPSDLGFDEIPPMEDVEIEMATDPDLTVALIEDVSSSMSANMTTAAGGDSTHLPRPSSSSSSGGGFTILSDRIVPLADDTPPRRRSNHRLSSLECPNFLDHLWLKV